jgi:predicted transcriptional regulator
MKDLEILEMLGLIEFSEEKHGKRKKKVPVINYDEIQVSIVI